MLGDKGGCGSATSTRAVRTDVLQVPESFCSTGAAPRPQGPCALRSDPMKTYLVRMVRRDGGWDAGIDGVGWIRVDRLTGAERAVRAHLAVLGFGDATTAAVEIGFGADLGAQVTDVRDARAAADGWVRYASERSRELAARLASEGLSGAEVAMILGVSPQRVSQLLSQNRVASPETVDLRDDARDDLRDDLRDGLRDELREDITPAQPVGYSATA